MNYIGQMDEILTNQIKKVLFTCRDVVYKHYHDALIVLYGSQARGQANADSDLDLLILLNRDVSREMTRSIRNMLYEIGLQNDLVISVIVRDVNTWNTPIYQATSLYKEIEKEGIYIK